MTTGSGAPSLASRSSGRRFRQREQPAPAGWRFVERQW